MKQEILYFILSFFAAMLWYRILFFVIPIYFKKPFTRSILKLRWHHLHYGAILTLIGVSLLLIFTKSILAIILIGVGLGFIMDLFIPSLLLETDRETELVIYKRSLIPTIILFISIAALLFILSII